MAEEDTPTISFFDGAEEASSLFETGFGKGNAQGEENDFSALFRGGNDFSLQQPQATLTGPPAGGTQSTKPNNDTLEEVSLYDENSSPVSSPRVDGGGPALNQIHSTAATPPGSSHKTSPLQPSFPQHSNSSPAASKHADQPEAEQTEEDASCLFGNEGGSSEDSSPFDFATLSTSSSHPAQSFALSLTTTPQPVAPSSTTYATATKPPPQQQQASHEEEAEEVTPDLFGGSEDEPSVFDTIAREQHFPPATVGHSSFHSPFNQQGFGANHFAASYNSSNFHSYQQPQQPQHQQQPFFSTQPQQSGLLFQDSGFLQQHQQQPMTYGAPFLPNPHAPQQTSPFLSGQTTASISGYTASPLSSSLSHVPIRTAARLTRSSSAVSQTPAMHGPSSYSGLHDSSSSTFAASTYSSYSSSSAAPTIATATTSFSSASTTSRYRSQSSGEGASSSFHSKQAEASPFSQPGGHLQPAISADPLSTFFPASSGSSQQSSFSNQPISSFSHSSIQQAESPHLHYPSHHQHQQPSPQFPNLATNEGLTRVSSSPDISLFNPVSQPSPLHYSAGHRRALSGGQMIGPQDHDPLLFHRPHPIAVFTFGGSLITCIPVAGRTFRIHNGVAPENSHTQYCSGPLKVFRLNQMLTNTSLYNSLKQFPGPLKANSSKDKVLRFITSKVENPEEEMFSEDVQLLWGLLKIMCEHYGELLPPAEGRRKENVGLQPAQKAICDLLCEANHASGWINDADQEPIATQLLPTEQARQRALKEIEGKLALGNLEEACSTAVSAHLWEHAFLLSSQINQETQANVVKQFTLTALREGSPLRALYLLYSRQPAELFRKNQNSNDSALLDSWRENLAMIIANRTAGDIRVIGQLGDTLWQNRRRAAAAHFCYLLAEHPFGQFENPNARLILLGADHKTQRNYFINAESMQRTEVFEYTKKLGNSQYSLPSLQVYKFIYANLLADYGLLEEAWKYYQAVLATVKDNLPQYNKLFVTQLASFGKRLTEVNGSLPRNSSSSRLSTVLSSFLTKTMSAIVGTEDSLEQEVVDPSAGIPKDSNNPSPTLVPSASFPTADSRSTATMAIPRSSSQDHFSNGDFQRSPTSLSSSTAPQMQPSSSSTSLTNDENDQKGSGSSLSKSPSESSKSDDKGEKRSKWWERIFRKSESHEMVLGGETEFVYNEELGVWHQKGKPPQMPAKAPPPPPMSTPIEQTPQRTDAGPPPPSSLSSSPALGGPLGQSNGLSGGAPPAFSAQNRFSSSSRGSRRYLDSFNPEQEFQASAPSAGPAGMPPFPLPSLAGNGGSMLIPGMEGGGIAAPAAPDGFKPLQPPFFAQHNSAQPPTSGQ
ncbi:COPII coat assembly protein SEC16 [Balamuthia mandrillaris]